MKSWMVPSRKYGYLYPPPSVHDKGISRQRAVKGHSILPAAMEQGRLSNGKRAFPRLYEKKSIRFIVNGVHRAIVNRRRQSECPGAPTTCRDLTEVRLVLGDFTMDRVF